MLASTTFLAAGAVPLFSTGALADCATVGSTTTCGSGAPNPYTNPVGTGSNDHGKTVVVEDGSTISVTEKSAISLGNDAHITLESGATVSNAVNGSGGNYGTGFNTIEFNSNGTLIVEEGASVIKTGSASNAEAVNVHGAGNRIENHGLIQVNRGAAIWFQDTTSGAKNVVDNFGTVAVVGGSGSVIGASGNLGIQFYNRTGAEVIGGISFAGGNDDLFFEAGSLVTGNINGGGGVNNLTLQGAAGSDDILGGNISNFSTLTKDGEGKWTISGSLSGFTIATVKNGTLALTGNNASYTGSVVVESAGTLEARAQSLPTNATNTNNVQNDGLVRFTQGDDGTYVGQITGSGAVEKVGGGVLSLAPSLAQGNTYSGGTVIKEGTIAVGADNALGAADGGITFDGGTLRFDAAFDLSAGRDIVLDAAGGTIDTQGFTTTLTQGTQGAGELTKAGTGSLILLGDNIHAGGTTVLAGELALEAGAVLSGGGDVFVAARGTLGGYGSVTGDVDNQGVIGVADALAAFAGRPGGDFTINGRLSNAGVVQVGGAAVGNNLIVDGDYVGAGGVVALNTQLGNDVSPTDQLRVTGSTSGHSFVTVRNVGGEGAQTRQGIKIIDVAEASNGTFSLLGDYVIHGDQAVVGGAYAYTLWKNGRTNPPDGDWYLRSELTNPPTQPEGPIYQGGVPTYEAYPMALLALNGLPTLQQRVGNRSWTDGSQADPTAIEGRGIWGRIEAAHSSFEPRMTTSGTSYDVNTLKLQAGVDSQLVDSDSGKLIGGIVAHYGHAASDTTSFYGDGEIGTNGYGLGATLTWYGVNGLYVDGQAQLTWYDSDLGSELTGSSLVSGNNAFGYALSLEAGQKVGLDQNWSMTPQAQLVYSAVDFDDFDDAFGAAVSLENGDSLTGRLGLTLDYEKAWAGEDGATARTHAYGIANLYYEFLDASRVEVAGVALSAQNDRLWGGLGLGGSYNWSDDRYSIYGEGLVNTSLNDFGDNYKLQGNVGFRYKW